MSICPDQCAYDTNNAFSTSIRLHLVIFEDRVGGWGVGGAVDPNCTHVSIFKMQREKGQGWDYVKISELKDKHQHKVECKYCKHVFVAAAGASCTREHFLHISDFVNCTADEVVLKPVLYEIRAH